MLILLDIDGVMVPAKGWKPLENMRDGMPLFTQKATEALRSLISKDSTVILTTSHRSRFTIPEWRGIFKARGITIDNLDSLKTNQGFKKRREEIVEWFTLNNVTEDFAIIDDDTSLYDLPNELKNRLISTSSLVGLTPKHIDDFRERLYFAE